MTGLKVIVNQCSNRINCKRHNTIIQSTIRCCNGSSTCLDPSQPGFAPIRNPPNHIFQNQVFVKAVTLKYNCFKVTSFWGLIIYKCNSWRDHLARHLTWAKAPNSSLILSSCLISTMIVLSQSSAASSTSVVLPMYKEPMNSTGLMPGGTQVFPFKYYAWWYTSVSL